MELKQITFNFDELMFPAVAQEYLGDEFCIRGVYTNPPDKIYDECIRMCQELNKIKKNSDRAELIGRIYNIEGIIPNRDLADINPETDAELFEKFMLEQIKGTIIPGIKETDDYKCIIGGLKLTFKQPNTAQLTSYYLKYRVKEQLTKWFNRDDMMYAATMKFIVGPVITAIRQHQVLGPLYVNDIIKLKLKGSRPAGFFLRSEKMGYEFKGYGAGGDNDMEFLVEKYDGMTPKMHGNIVNDLKEVTRGIVRQALPMLSNMIIASNMNNLFEIPSAINSGGNTLFRMNRHRSAITNRLGPLIDVTDLGWDHSIVHYREANITITDRPINGIHSFTLGRVMVSCRAYVPNVDREMLFRAEIADISFRSWSDMNIKKDFDHTSDKYNIRCVVVQKD